MRTLKKHFGLAAFCVVALAIAARAAVVKYNAYLANETALTYSRSYTLPLNQYFIDDVSAVTIASSATLNGTSFSSGAASTATITVSSSPAQGIAGQSICIASVCLQDGVQWNHSPIGLSSSTAFSIYQAILANTYLSSIIVSTNPAGTSVIYTTATAVGQNYTLYSSSGAAITLSPPVTTTLGAASSVMVGGIPASFTINSAYIQVPSTAVYTLGLPVLYSTTGTAIGGLTTGTTYFVIPKTATSIQLAVTSTGAVAGLGIVLTSSSTPTSVQNIYNLTPGPILGTPSYKWQVSNDGVNWIDYLTNVPNVAISSVTLSSFVSTGTYNAWDFGHVDYAWMRLNVVAPTQGGIALQVAINGKNTSN